MKTLFKWLLRIVVGLSAVLVLTMLGIFLFVNPNQFKGTIEQQVQAQTGHVLKIQGPLVWRWSPMLSIELEDVVLENAAPFRNQLLTAKAIRTGIGLESLLSGKIFLNLKLEGLNLLLERNANAEGNWENLVKRLAKGKKTSEANETAESKTSTSTNTSISAENNASSSSGTRSNRVMLSGIKIVDGVISFRDLQKNKYYKVDQLNLSAENLLKGLLGVSNEVSVNFNLLSGDKPENQSLKKISLQGDWALKLVSDELQFNNASLKVELPSGKITSLEGSATVENLSKSPRVLGKLDSKNLDIKPWLEDLAVAPNPALPTEANIKTNFKYQAPYFSLNDLSIDIKDNGNLSGDFEINTSKLTATQLQLKGDFQGSNLRFGKIKVDALKGQLASNDGVINIAPLTVQLAQSVQQMTMQIDLRGKTPRYTLTQDGRNFEIKHLLSMFDIKDKIEGKTNLKMSLSASGSGINEIRSSLSGESNIEILDGKFYGIDLITVYKKAQENLHSVLGGLTKKQGFDIAGTLSGAQEIWKQQSAGSSSASTPFDSIRASLLINAGVINNNSLVIDHSEYDVKGAGVINLVSETIQYQSSALLKKNPYPANDELGKYLYASALPIKIDGTMTNLSIRPDFKTYTNNAVNYAQKNVAQELIQKNLDKALGQTVNQLFDKLK